MVGTDPVPSLTADEAGQLEMMQVVLVGVGAGAAAALLFASVISGSIAAIFLFYLAPLPILIAALGFSHIAGLIAAAIATAVVTILSGTFFIAAPVIAFGAWWLGYSALLARPAADGGGALEWYPPGRLVLWAAVIGTLTIAAAVLSLGTDQQSVQAILRKLYERMLRDQSPVDLLVVASPAAAALFSTVSNLFNLWLAARIVKISGRLKRPWPDLAALTLPPPSSGLLAAALAGSFLPDLFGMLSSAFAASLLMAFAMLGFAVLHAITRGMGSRVFVLAAVYAAVLVLVWSVLAMAILGLAEAAFHIRNRVARKRGPPSLRT
jgi:hypothetical protein